VFARPPGEKQSGIGLEQDRHDAIERDLRESLACRGRRQLLERLRRGLEPVDGRLGEGLVPAEHPQRAGLMKEAAAVLRIVGAPQIHRAQRHRRVNSAGAVCRPDDTRLAARARACVAGSPGIDERDARAPSHQLKRRPAAEGAGADHGHARRLPARAGARKGGSSGQGKRRLQHLASGGHAGRPPAGAIVECNSGWRPGL
jgi:hypothetical protein